VKIRFNGRERNVKAVWMEKGIIKMIDQRLLPHKFKIFTARNINDVIYTINEMVVRGAPAIGVTASYGLAQARIQGKDTNKAAKLLKNTRPTAYDLFYAVDRVLNAIKNGEEPIEASERYADEIVDQCRRIGKYGEKLIKDGFRILTHCNAGALATVEYGTALSPIRFAHYNKKKLFVYVDETRPRLQGARLTAWELYQEGIEHCVIADDAAGHYMKRGEIDMVIVGADRIVRNGDIANKIGTYEKAVLAKENSIPFYVAAPMSTIDVSIKTGDNIPIEERPQKEVLFVGQHRITPKGSSAKNPAFDITPARYIAGIITERGVFRPSDIKKAYQVNKTSFIH
jgi:translation initiation factor eIF-2B subunit alpha/methylthioribose-1-phosphate isomerase